MSHTIRRSQSTTTNRVLRLSSYDLPSYWSAERLPTPQQQADNMVMWCGDHQPQPELAAHGALPEIAAWIGTAISAFPGRAGIDWLNGELKEEFYQMWGDPLNMSVKLTMKGWAKYEELKKRDIDSRVAFMAMKFGDASLNRVVEECFRPAVDRTGFRLRLLTDDQGAGLIDDQLRAAILGARFIIADLSHGNQGAYWEAGFGEGLGLPVIYTCSSEKWMESKTHFDTNHMVTIIWDIDNLAMAQNQMTATIRATLRAEAKQAD